MSTNLSQEYQGTSIGFFIVNLSDIGHLSQVAKHIWGKTQELSTTSFSTMWKKLVYSKR